MDRSASSPRTLALLVAALLVVSAAPADPVRGAGSALIGYGTATIDGRIAPAEWDRAARLTIELALPVPGSPEVVPAAFLVMNDATNLYAAVQIGRPIAYASMSVAFDSDGDGTFREVGDDLIGGSIDEDGESRFFDGAFVRCPAGTPGTCGVADTETSPSAPTAGTTDGAAAALRSGGLDVIETSHPLDSRDDSRDASLSAGDTVGFTLDIQLIDAALGLPCASAACGSSTSATGRLSVAASAATVRPGPSARATATRPADGTTWVAGHSVVTLTGGPETASLTYWTAPLTRGGPRTTGSGDASGMRVVSGTRTVVDITASGTTVLRYFATAHDGRPGAWHSITVRVDATRPEAMDPVASAFVQGAVLGEASSLVTWEPVDAISGVAYSTLEESTDAGRHWTRIETKSHRVRRRMELGTWYAYRVRVVDAVGNKSVWKYGRWMKADIMEATTSTVSLAGRWTPVTDADASGGSLLRAAGTDATASVRVFGSAVAVVMPTGPDHGSAIITVDGHATAVPLGGPAADRRIVWSGSWSTATWHAVTIGVGYGPGRVDLDAIATLAPSRPTDLAMQAASGRVEAERLPASTSGGAATAGPFVQPEPADLLGHWTGEGQLAWRPIEPGMLDLGVPVPHGRFRAVIFVSKGPDYGVVEMHMGGSPTQTVDLYAPSLRRYALYVDTIDQSDPLGRGDMYLSFAVTGKNPASTGMAVGVDLIMLAPIP